MSITVAAFMRLVHCAIFPRKDLDTTSIDLMRLGLDVSIVRRIRKYAGTSANVEMCLDDEYHTSDYPFTIVEADGRMTVMPGTYKVDRAIRDQLYEYINPEFYPHENLRFQVKISSGNLYIFVEGSETFCDECAVGLGIIDE